VSDTDLRNLERKARAWGIDPRDAAAELLGIERSRFVLTALLRDPPSSKSRRATLYIKFHWPHTAATDRIVWATPIESLDEIVKNGWGSEDSALIVDTTTNRVVPTGELVELVEGWPDRNNPQRERERRERLARLEALDPAPRRFTEPLGPAT
jgi:hypothetical protein